MSVYLAAYDVARDGARAKVARVLAHYGARIQKSVFQIELDLKELPDLQRTIGSLLARDDRFDLVPIDLDPRRHHLRWQTTDPQREAILFV